VLYNCTKGGKDLDNYPSFRKCLTVGIILLFIGVTIVPTINFNTVKASTNDDLVEVTTQACGIKGFEDTTIKLTRQQYQNLKEYLVEFRSRLNQTTTREEAVPIFKEAVVELNKYGLLPEGMSVERAQRLVTGGSQKPIESILNNRHQEIFPNLDNAFCLFYLDATKPLYPEYPFLRVYCPLVIILIPLGWIFRIISIIAMYISEITQNIPLKLLNIIAISGVTDFYSFGLKFLVVKTHSYAGPLLVGYTGLMLRPSDDKAYFFGFALAVMFA
jgi:hypothetical protein